MTPRVFSRSTVGAVLVLLFGSLVVGADRPPKGSDDPFSKGPLTATPTRPPKPESEKRQKGKPPATWNYDRIQKSLENKVEFDFVETPLAQVCEYFKELTGLPCFLT